VQNRATIEKADGSSGENIMKKKLIICGAVGLVVAGALLFGILRCGKESADQE
jgi:hypothetical protein